MTQQPYEPITQDKIRQVVCSDCGANGGEYCKDQEQGRSHFARIMPAQMAFLGARPEPHKAD